MTMCIRFFHAQTIQSRVVRLQVKTGREGNCIGETSVRVMMLGTVTKLMLVTRLERSITIEVFLFSFNMVLSAKSTFRKMLDTVQHVLHCPCGCGFVLGHTNQSTELTTRSFRDGSVALAALLGSKIFLCTVNYIFLFTTGRCDFQIDQPRRGHALAGHHTLHWSGTGQHRNCTPTSQ